MSNVGTNLDIVEMATIDARRDAQTSTIPRHFVAWVAFTDILCQCIDGLWFGITTHQRNACDVATEFLHKAINCQGIEGFTDVLSQISAVASWTMAGTARDIH